MNKEIKEPYGFIYITTNMVNGKKYIGQRKFYKNWEKYLGSGTSLKNAIAKYGKDKFIKDIVAIAYSKDELNKLEIEWITEYNAVESNDFYNIATGGSNGNNFAGKTEEEMKLISDKMSESKKGEKNSFYGKHFSEESKEKLRISHIGRYEGEKNPMYGKVRTIDEKENISRGRVENGLTRMVKQIDKNTLIVLKVWESIASATKNFNLSRSAIKNVLSSKRLDIKSAGGYYWEYEDEENIKYAKLKRKEVI